MHVVSKEVESIVENVCKIEACMQAHDQVMVKKQWNVNSLVCLLIKKLQMHCRVQKMRCQQLSTATQSVSNTSLGSKGEETSTAIESVYLLLYFHNRNT